MHDAWGRLRGHAEPAPEVGDKLLAINPRFRLSWIPGVGDAGYWVISDRRGDPLWRDAGLARMKRYAQVGAERMDAYTYWDTEAMIDGDHTVAVYPEGIVGSDRFYHELRQGEHVMKTMLDTLDRGLKEKELADIEGEMALDPTYAEYVRTSAVEAYWALKRTHISTHGFKEDACQPTVPVGATLTPA